MTPGETPLARARRWYYTKPAALRLILAINAAVYVLIVFGSLAAGMRPFMRAAFALSPVVLDALLQPWQYLTHSFVHLDPGFFGLLHIAFNLLWLVWVGQEYEELYGTRQMTIVYLGSAVAGGLLAQVMHALLPGAAAFAQPVYGATAPVLGVIAAVVGRMPHKQIGLLFIGVIPLRYALLAFLALDVLFGINGGTFFAAHVGAAAFGYLYARSQAGGSGFGSWTSGSGRGASGRTQTETAEAEGGVLQRLEAWLSGGAEESSRRSKKSSTRRTAESAAAAESGVDPGEVDRILEKISESGYESLTEAEKRTLYQASQE